MSEEQHKKQTFDLDGIGRVHAWGNPAKPLVILMHGFMQTGSAWAAVAEKLAEDHWVFAPDLLGHGASVVSPNAPLSLEAYVEQLHRLIEWAKEEQTTTSPAETSVRPQTAALVGYSLGGRIAALFALQYPNEIDTLVLESAGLGPQNEEERAARAEKTQAQVARLDASVAADPAQPLKAFVDYWEDLPLFATQADLSEETRTRIRTERLANDPAALRRNLTEAGQDKMVDVRPGLANLNKPILYLVGERDVAYTKIAQSLMRAWAENHDETRLLNTGFVQVSVIPQAGHNTHLERPEEFALLVSAFLSRTR